EAAECTETTDGCGRNLPWQEGQVCYGSVQSGDGGATVVWQGAEEGDFFHSQLVSRRKGQVYLTVVYDLERRVLLWVGDDRTEEAVRPFFTKELGTRRCHSLRVICMDMWAAYANLVKEYAPQAQILFDRFHIVKHLHEAVAEVRGREIRC